jgi:hypothetical protein
MAQRYCFSCDNGQRYPIILWEMAERVFVCRACERVVAPPPEKK